MQHFVDADRLCSIHLVNPSKSCNESNFREGHFHRHRFIFCVAESTVVPICATCTTLMRGEEHMKYFLPIILILLALLFVWMTYVALSDLHDKSTLMEKSQQTTTFNEQPQE